MEPSGSPTTRGGRQYSEGGGDDDCNALLVSFYTRTYPSAEAFADGAADLDLHEINDAVTELATEVAALREETDVLSAHVQTIQQRRTGSGGSGGNGVTDGGAQAATATGSQPDMNGSNSTAAAAAAAATTADTTATSNTNNSTIPPPRAGGSAGGGGRRGRSYRRRSLGALDLFMRVDDKAALLRQETARLQLQDERMTKDAEGVQEVLVATVEEALRRQQELQLEALQFEREVVGDVDDAAAEGGGGSGGAAPRRRNPFEETRELTVSAAAAATTADELLRYLERRHTTQVNFLDKLEVQCQAVEQDIARAQQLVRQRRVAGEVFQAVDLEQLRIEHKQFTERMAAKNSELAELKGTSTRTVQVLNQLMGQLNNLASEQTRLKRESKSRTEYLSRCDREIATASAEAQLAESRHDTLKAQQEAIKAPKIEEYMAQKAEEVELEKAVKNWERKVQIAEGQAAVVRQHMRRMQSQRNAAVKYANEKKQFHQQQQQQRRSLPTSSASGKPVVGGTRSLLQQRRQQQQQQQHQMTNAAAHSSPSPPAVAAAVAAVTSNDGDGNDGTTM